MLAFALSPHKPIVDNTSMDGTTRRAARLGVGRLSTAIDPGAGPVLPVLTAVSLIPCALSSSPFSRLSVEGLPRERATYAISRDPPSHTGGASR